MKKSRINIGNDPITLDRAKSEGHLGDPRTYSQCDKSMADEAVTLVSREFYRRRQKTFYLCEKKFVRCDCCGIKLNDAKLPKKPCSYIMCDECYDNSIIL
ncbi:MAG: hypothetical protein ACOCWC_04935 [Bacteroidota bacterium]